MDQWQMMLRRWKRALGELFKSQGKSGGGRPQIKMCPVCGKFVDIGAKNCGYCDAELEPGSKPQVDAQGSGEPLNPTMLIFALCIAFYFISLVFSSKEPDRDGLLSMLNPAGVVLFRLGANSSLYVFGGEYWRLITYIFLHGGVLHLVMNMMALAQLGPLVFQCYGGRRFWLISLLTGVAGGLASALFSFKQYGHLSIGFSGSLFGFLGICYVYFNKRGFREEAERFKSYMIWGNLILIGLTITGIMPIDNAAHIGGMLMGLGLGYLFETRFVKFLNPLVERVILATFLLWWGYGLFRCALLIHSGYG